MLWKLNFPRLPRLLIVFVIVGFIIRILLSIYSSDPDMVAFASSSVSMLYGNGPYTYLIVYPPGWIYLLNIIGHITQFFVRSTSILVSNEAIVRIFLNISFDSSWLAVPAYSLAEKSTLWMFDFLTAILLYIITFRITGSQKNAILAFGIWFLNPLVIVESSVHGAFDIIPVFFTLLALFFIDSRKNFFAGLSLGIGFMIKLFPIYFLLLIIPLIFRKNLFNVSSSLKESFIFVVGIIISTVLILFPSFLTLNYANYIRIVLTGRGLSADLSGYNLWSVINLPFLYSVKAILEVYFPAVQTILFYLITGLLLVFALLIGKYGNENVFALRNIFVFLIFGMLITYMSTQTQPQYILWFLPFLAILVASFGKLRVSYAIVSIATTLGYVLFIAGPLFFFEPLFIFTTVPSIAYMSSNILYWYKVSGLYGTLMNVIVFVFELFFVFKFIQVLRSKEKGVVN